MSHTVLPTPTVGGGSLVAMDRCGNEFHSLHDMIMWLIRHHKIPNPPDPPDHEPWYRHMTEIAEGLQKVVIAASMTDVNIRKSVALEGFREVQAGLEGVETAMK